MELRKITLFCAAKAREVLSRESIEKKSPDAGLV
jgi:hypothetical protein